VLAGVRGADDPWSLAALPLKLPRARYALAKGPVVIAPERAAFAWDLGGYQFTRYKKAKRKPADLQLDASARVKEALDMAAAVRLVRDLVNTPAEDMGPEQLSDVAREQAELFGGEFDEWVGDELLAQNFPAIHAVGRAAARPPRLLEINWGNPRHPRVAIVGKGVCFDSGGLDIKPAAGMLLMKKDMGGAAHALALGRMVMAAKLPVRLAVLTPVVENAISGDAMRPGDVLASRAGISIEVGNTDAEGRLILADALTRAGELEPALTIDLATLTGAARIALGPQLPPYYTDDDELADQIEAAAQAVGDPVWRMPLWKPYGEALDSDVAEIKNDPDGWAQAGSVTAALFLQRFAPKGPWAHLDIFAWNPRGRPGFPAGAEAQAIRGLYRMIRERFA
jgi:leucyl aminopeptidase